MNILSVAVSFPNENAMWWRINNISRILKNQGFNCDLLCFVFNKRNIQISAMTNDANNNLFVIDILSPLNGIRTILALRKKQYTYIYGNTHFGTLLSIIINPLLFNKTIVFDLHGGLVEEGELDRKNPFSLAIKKLITFICFSYSHLIICVSKKMIEYFKKKYPNKKYIYVTNGVDLDYFSSGKYYLEKLNFKKKYSLSDKIIVGYIGGFQSCQGLQNFLKAISEFKNNDFVAFLLVGGEKEIKDKNIIFMSRVPRKQIRLYYEICDILVLPRPSCPAVEIAAPTKFAEYLAMGKPILSTNVGDACEMIKKYNCGMVIQTDDPYDIIDGINKFIIFSREELNEMSKNSRLLAEKEFNWEEIGINLYNELYKN